MRLFTVLTLLFASMSFAAPKPKTGPAVKIDTKKIEALVNEFYIEKNQKSYEMKSTFLSLKGNGFRPGDKCGPSRSSDCIDAACEKLGEYGCNDKSEIDRVIAVCKGVDGDCIDSACAKLGEYGCNDFSEIQNVAGVCRNVFDGRCLEVVCTKLGEYGCNDFSEIQKVAGICAGRVDSSCIESVCTRLGEYGCNDFSEVQAVAKSCGGR